ncbi:hypothetical protein [Ralstonia sp. 1138]|uniref:hypothetical protein n=1 Tax=Ralstonia sp. 1138 TaxID=3156423 RepID=UPI00339719A2
MEHDINCFIAATLGVLNPCSAQKRMLKRAEGRYTLDEAAHAIAGARGPAKQIKLLLCQAAQSRKLVVYAADDRTKFYPSTSRPAQGSHEAYWHELNRWIEKHMPGATYRLPAPAAPSTPSTQKPPSAQIRPNTRRAKAPASTRSLAASVDKESVKTEDEGLELPDGNARSALAADLHIPTLRSN